MTASIPARESWTAEAFNALTRLRGERIVYGAGVAMTVRITLTAPLGKLQVGEHTGFLRVSRSLGLRKWDIHGWALRIPHAPDGVQDLLLDTVASTGKIGRHLLWPRPGPLAGPASTVTRCQLGKGKATILAVPRERRSSTLEELRKDVALGRAQWELYAPGLVGIVNALEVTGDGRWMEFDAAHTGAGIRPLGMIERIRHTNYAPSRGAADVEVPGPRERSKTRSTQHS